MKISFSHFFARILLIHQRRHFIASSGRHHWVSSMAPMPVCASKWFNGSFSFGVPWIVLGLLYSHWNGYASQMNILSLSLHLWKLLQCYAAAATDGWDSDNIDEQATILSLFYHFLIASLVPSYLTLVSFPASWWTLSYAIYRHRCRRLHDSVREMYPFNNILFVNGIVRLLHFLFIFFFFIFLITFWLNVSMAHSPPLLSLQTHTA